MEPSLEWQICPNFDSTSLWKLSTTLKEIMIIFQLRVENFLF